MKVKIFNVSNGSKVMVMETEEFVEFYLQINSSDWHFCVGCKADFDNVDEAFAESVADQYYGICDEDEKVLEAHHTETLAEEEVKSEDKEETKPVEFRQELVQLMVQSLTANLELCAGKTGDKKEFGPKYGYCLMLMDKLEKAYQKNNIEELDKLFGMCRKVLLENDII